MREDVYGFGPPVKVCGYTGAGVGTLEPLAASAMAATASPMAITASVLDTTVTKLKFLISNSSCRMEHAGRCWCSAAAGCLPRRGRIAATNQLPPRRVWPAAGQRTPVANLDRNR